MSPILLQLFLPTAKLKSIFLKNINANLLRYEKVK